MPTQAGRGPATRWRPARRRPSLPIAAALVGLLLAVAGCSAAAQPDPSAGRPTARTLLVFGDSYAIGAGALTERRGFAPQLGRLLDLETAVDGVGATGFLDPGQFGYDQRYLTRVRALPPEDLARDVILVEGGLNDRDEDAGELLVAATETLQVLVSLAPDATVVLVGAPAPVPSDPAASVAVNAALSRAADDVGVHFVDPVEEGWFTTANADRYVSPDGLHPSQEGHDHIAERLAEDLRPLLGSD